MRILHTADWHIGKKLHSYELANDFDRFIEWLQDNLQEQKVDVLLISGDVFDLANPSAAARSQYYQSLVKLRNCVDKIILTGGNHDSPAMLNAPKELMKALNLEVIGGLPENIEDALIPIKNKKGETEVVIAAIPFLRNPDLPIKSEVINSYEDRLEVLRKGITEVYRNAAGACAKNYPETPAIAMGHLFTAGVETSDSERDIQIGNQAAVQSSAFGEYFKYVALGHIHKPQKVNASQPVYYSGSPLPLSFSERKDEKRVLLIDTEKGWIPESFPVPPFRKLIKISGNMEHIQLKLNQLEDHGGLTQLLEIELHEKEFQTKYIQDLEELITNFDKKGYQVVKHKVSFKEGLKESGEFYDQHTTLKDLDPENVFEKRLNQEDFNEEERREIRMAFQELLEEIK